MRRVDFPRLNPVADVISASLNAPQLNARVKKFNNPCALAASSNVFPVKFACVAFSIKPFSRVACSSFDSRKNA